MTANVQQRQHPSIQWSTGNRRLVSSPNAWNAMTTRGLRDMPTASVSGATARRSDMTSSSAAAWEGAMEASRDPRDVLAFLVSSAAESAYTNLLTSKRNSGETLSSG